MDDNHRVCINSKILPYVIESGYGVAIKPFIHADRIVAFNVMIYLVSGKMEVIEDGKAFTLTSGKIFFLKEGVHHWGEKKCEQGTSWYYIHFTSTKIEDNSSSEISLPKIQSVKEKSEMDRLFSNLIHLNKIEESAEIIFKKNIILNEILSLCVQTPDSSTEGNHAECIKSFIKAHAISDFSSEELEEETSLSYKYAGTCFKRQFGETIRSYQNKVKIEKAEELLTTTQLSIYEIAEQTGFCDQFYFSKIFHNIKGTSPLKFRNSFTPKL